MRRTIFLVPTVALLIFSAACTPSRNEIAQARLDAKAKPATPSAVKPTTDQILAAIDLNTSAPVIMRRQDLVGPPSIVLPPTVTGLRMIWHSDRPLAIVDDGFTAEETDIIRQLSAMKGFGATPVVAAAGPGVADLHVLIRRAEKSVWFIKTIATDPEATTIIASWYTNVFTDRADAFPVAMRGWNSWFVPRDRTADAMTRLMKTKAASSLNQQVAAFEDAFTAGTADLAAASTSFAASIDKIDGSTPVDIAAASYAAGFNALLLDKIATGKDDDTLARSMSKQHLNSGTWTYDGWNQLVRSKVIATMFSYMRIEATNTKNNAIDAAIHLVPGRVVAATPDGGIVRVAVKHAFQTKPGEFLGSWPASEPMPRCSAVSTVEVTNTSKNMVTLRQLGVFDETGRPLDARIDPQAPVDGSGALVLAPNASTSIQVTFRLPNQTGQTTAVQIGSISGIPTAVDGTGSPTATTMLPISIDPPKRLPYSNKQN